MVLTSTKELERLRALAAQAGVAEGAFITWALGPGRAIPDGKKIEKYLKVTKKG